MEQSPSHSEKIIKGSLIVLTLTFLGSVFAYLIRILFSRTLSIDDYGLFYAILGLVNLIAIYMDLGFGYSVVYLFPKHFKTQDYSTAWNIFVHGHTVSFLMSIVVCITLALSAPFLANNYFKVPGSENLIYLFCFYLICYVILNSLTQLFSSMHKEKYYSSITVFKWLLTLLISGIFILLGFSNIFFFTIALILGHLFTAIIFIFLFFWKSDFVAKNKIVWEKKLFNQMFFLAMPSLLETIIYTALTAADIFLLTLFRGVRDVGIYNIIFPIASIPVILFNPINALVLPLVSNLMEGEKEKLEQLITKILEVIPFVSLYFVLFTVLFPSPIVGIVFGTKWQGLVEIPLIILSVGAIPVLMSGILGAITLGMGRIKEKLKVVSVTAAIFFAFNIFMTWKFGIMGTVISGCIGSSVLCLLLARTIYQQIPFKIHLGFYFKLFLFSLGIFIFIRLTGLRPYYWYDLIFYGIIYSLIYAALGHLLKVYDKQFFTKLLRRTNS